MYCWYLRLLLRKMFIFSDKYIVCCGGARITHELAKELGYDAGFGAGKYADDVATFAVTDMVKRGFK